MQCDACLPHALDPRRILVSEQRRRVGAVPGVARAPLELDLGEPVANDAVAAGEDRAIRADLVEPRPDGRRGRIVGDDDVVPAGGRTDRDADRRECRGAGLAAATRRRRRSTPITAASGFSICIRKRTTVDRLSTRDRRVLVRAPGRRGERRLVVLLAPAGERLALANLRARASRGRRARPRRWRARGATRSTNANGGRARATSSRICSTLVIASSLNVMWRE